MFCRTRFAENDDGIVEGLVVDMLSLPHPLRIHPTTLRPDEIRPLLEEEADKLLDLSTGRLLNAALFLLDDGAHILTITLHHAAAGE